MIDAYKIEEATKDYINKNNYFAKHEEDSCVDIEFAYKGGATKHNLLWKAMGNIEDVLKELEDSYGISLL